MHGRHLTVTAASGRRFTAWTSHGDATRAVLLQVGTPCAGLPYRPWVDDVVGRGCRFVTYSRPGYASSGRQEGRSVADCASDVAALAATLGLERIHVVGWSGGGPHALACAALLPDLVASTATLAGVAPATAAGLDWLDGMAKENREEFGAALAGRDALERLLRDVATALRERTGESLADALGGLVTPVDRAALNGPFADWVARSMRTALASDIWGWLDDDLAFVRDWGFSLDAIRVPISVWQGRHDAMVPFGHGEWLAGNVPGARARLLDDEGHLSLPLRFAEIVDDLLTAA